MARAAFSVGPVRDRVSQAARSLGHRVVIAVNRTVRCEHAAMTGRLYSGSRFTTVKQGELSKGLVAAMLRQLNIDREDF